MPHSFDTSDFSTENYFRLLDLMSADGYGIVDFLSVDHGQKHLILRHDVDFDLQAALKLAEQEARKGYKAIYFVLLTSEFYNPFSKNNFDALASILALGHDIGLHFDTSLHVEDESLLSKAAEKECSILEQLSGNEVKVISMHRPPSNLIGENINFAGRLNTYSSRFTKDMGYCSDSRGAWHYGSPFESEAYKAGKALQLLTHPIWWTQKISQPPQQSVEGFLRNKQEFLGREAERNCTAYSHTDDGLP
jgi:hypothetical protein